MSGEHSEQPTAKQADQPLREERAERPSGGDRLLDFLEQARTLFRGRWFVLLTCTVAAALALSVFDLISSWGMASFSVFTVAVVVLPLAFSLASLVTMVALIRRADEGTLNARRVYSKILFVLCVIGGVTIALSILPMLFTSIFSGNSAALSESLLTLLCSLPLLALLWLTLDCRGCYNGFYKNLYGMTQGLYIKRAYAKRAGIENLILCGIVLALPYLFSALYAALPEAARAAFSDTAILLSVSDPDVMYIVSCVLSLLGAAFSFLFFRQAESVERTA